MKLKTIVYWFFLLVFVFWSISALIVTFAPILGMCFGVVYAACESGNVWFMFGAQWILPVVLVLLTSPAWIDYLNLRHERTLRKETLEDIAADTEDLIALRK